MRLLILHSIAPMTILKKAGPLAALLLCLGLYPAAQTSAQSGEESKMVKAPPKGMTEDEVIRRFAAREKEFRDAREDRKSTRLNSSHIQKSRMPSSA